MARVDQLSVVYGDWKAPTERKNDKSQRRQHRDITDEGMSRGF